MSNEFAEAMAGVSRFLNSQCHHTPQLRLTWDCSHWDTYCAIGLGVLREIQGRTVPPGQIPLNLGRFTYMGVANRIIRRRPWGSLSPDNGRLIV